MSVYLNIIPKKAVEQIPANSSELTIADTAHQLGIYDMGRFASMYKNHFVELPSQTLLKPPADSTSPFITFK